MNSGEDSAFPTSSSSSSASHEYDGSLSLSSRSCRAMHNREIPCSIDQSNGHHTFHQGCCVNVFCRHISRVLRSLDFGQFHSWCTEFLLNPQVSGFHVLHSTETDPSPTRDCTAVVNEMLDLSGYTPVKKDGLNVRGLCIATGQYSSFCGCAVDLVLGGSDHMDDDDDLDRGDEENGKKGRRDQWVERQRTIRHMMTCG